MAQSGFNGRNETRVGYSYGLDLSFLDETGQVIVIENIPEPIEMTIPRDKTLPSNVYTFVNTSNMTLTPSQQVLTNSFTISSKNASLHIQIKPVNPNLAYLFLLKYGSTPVLTTTSDSTGYDFWTILCPNSSDYVTVNDSKSIDSFYLVFFNQANVNGFIGFALFAF